MMIANGTLGRMRRYAGVSRVYGRIPREGTLRPGDPISLVV